MKRYAVAMMTELYRRYHIDENKLPVALCEVIIKLEEYVEEVDRTGPRVKKSATMASRLDVQKLQSTAMTEKEVENTVIALVLQSAGELSGEDYFDPDGEMVDSEDD